MLDEGQGTCHILMGKEEIGFLPKQQLFPIILTDLNPQAAKSMCLKLHYL